MGTLPGEEPSFNEKSQTATDGSEPAVPAAGVLELDAYFTPETADANEATSNTVFSEEAENILKRVKKDLKKLTHRVEALEDETEISMLPDCDDPVGALLSGMAMKDRKRTFKIVYGIVKEYAGSDNADPARIPVLFRELFELCATGRVKELD